MVRAKNEQFLVGFLVRSNLGFLSTEKHPERWWNLGKRGLVPDGVQMSATQRAPNKERTILGGVRSTPRWATSRSFYMELKPDKPPINKPKIHGFHWGYNPLQDYIEISWDIQRMGLEPLITLILRAFKWSYGPLLLIRLSAPPEMQMGDSTITSRTSCFGYLDVSRSCRKSLGSVGCNPTRKAIYS